MSLEFAASVSSMLQRVTLFMGTGGLNAFTEWKFGEGAPESTRVAAGVNWQGDNFTATGAPPELTARYHTGNRLCHLFSHFNTFTRLSEFCSARPREASAEHRAFLDGVGTVCRSPVRLQQPFSSKNLNFNTWWRLILC